MTSPWSQQSYQQPYGQHSQQPQPPGPGGYAPPQGPDGHSGPPHGSGGQQNKRPLWWVIGAGAAVIVVLLAVILIPFGDDLAPNPGDIDRPVDIADTDLRPGNCLESLDPVTDNLLRQVPCGAAHIGEVVAEDRITDEDFASEEAYDTQAEEFCLPAIQDVVPSDVDEDALSTSTFYPSENTWRDGDRLITCLITLDRGYHFTGSFIAGDAQVHRGDV